DQDVLLAPRKARWLEADTSQEQVPPLIKSKDGAAGDECLQCVAGRHLDRSDRLDAKRLSARFSSECRDVLESDLGVETTGQHPVVLVHERVSDVNVAELKAW